MKPVEKSLIDMARPYDAQANGFLCYDARETNSFLCYGLPAIRLVQTITVVMKFWLLLGCKVGFLLVLCFLRRPGILNVLCRICVPYEVAFNPTYNSPMLTITPLSLLARFPNLTIGRGLNCDFFDLWILRIRCAIC